MPARFLVAAVLALVLLLPAAVRAEDMLVVVVARANRAAELEALRARLGLLGAGELTVRASPVPPGHALVTAPLNGPVAAAARALELLRRRLPGTSGTAEIRRADLSTPGVPGDAPAALTDLATRLTRDRRGYPVPGRVVANKGHAYASPAADLPPISEAVTALAPGEALLVVDERLICAPAASIDGGPAVRTPVAVSLEDPAAALERIARDSLECVRWLNVALSPFVSAERLAGPHRLFWVPASFAAALASPVERAKTRAYLSLKGVTNTGGGLIAYDVVYEDLERQRWRRVAFEAPLKERGLGIVVQPSGFALVDAQGKVLRPLPTADFKPRAVRRRPR
jgi:hypothetical protein